MNDDILRNRYKVNITFGMIVLNGMPYINYNLRSLYPFAHQIIVVEGAAPSAKFVSSENGHSLDSTLEELKRFQREEDFENKLIIVTAEDEGYSDGFWPEKDEMSQAYAKRATGNYLWQIDSDEFYLEKDMNVIIKMLEGNPQIKSVSFSMYTFWGDPGFIVNGYFLDKFIVNRIFAWGEGYKYLSHRPVTIVDENSIDLRKYKWVSPKQLRAKGIFMYHYELLFPKQVLDKCSYYKDAKWTTALEKVNDWLNNNYIKIGDPFRVHMMYSYISWLKYFKKNHPSQILKMLEDVKKDSHPGIELRNMDDARKILSSNKYKVSIFLLECYIPFDRFFEKTKNYIKSIFIGKLIISLKKRIKGDLIKIQKKNINASLSKGWQSPIIPKEQRKLTDHELNEMYLGKIIAPFEILANCIKAIKGEKKSILEIGCSTGYYSEVLSFLLKRKIQYTGVDYSQSMIHFAKSKYPNHDFEIGNATNLNFKNSEFEIVISGCCLLHIPEYSKAIFETARIAKEWVIFHRTPISNGLTQFYKKKAYGVSCVEIHFNENEFIELCVENNLSLFEVFDVSVGNDCVQKTYIFKKNGFNLGI